MDQRTAETLIWTPNRSCNQCNAAPCHRAKAPPSFILAHFSSSASTDCFLWSKSPVEDDRVSWCNGVVRTHPSEIKQQRTEAMQSVRVLARRLVPRTSNASTSTARLSTKSGAREEEVSSLCTPSMSTFFFFLKVSRISKTDVGSLWKVTWIVVWELGHWFILGGN
jgi:hypothetical protein